jgi:hypothetical protein
MIVLRGSLSVSARPDELGIEFMVVVCDETPDLCSVSINSPYGLKHLLASTVCPLSEAMKFVVDHADY